MSTKKKRTSITITASTAYITYAVNHILGYVTNGNSRWPHQMVIRFKNALEIEGVEDKNYLHAQVHVWVDVGNRMGVEFLIDFDIMRDESAHFVWVLAPESIHIKTFDVPKIFIICTDKRNLRPLGVVDTEVLNVYREKKGCTNPRQFTFG